MSLAENRFVVGVGKQTVKNTPVAATAFPRWGDGTTVAPDLKVERVREGDGTVGYTRVIKNLQLWKGKIVHARPRSIDLGFMLDRVMGVGSDAVGALVGGVYPHTFTPQMVRDYCTIWPQWQLATPEAIKVQDAIFHSMSLSGQAGSLLSAEYEYTGIAALDDTTAMTPSYDASTAPFHFTNGIFSVDGSTVGTVAPYIRKFKVDYKHPLDEGMQTETINVADFVSTVREVAIELELLWQDFTQFKKVYWNSGTTDSGLIGSGALALTFYPGGDATQASTLQLNVPTMHYEAAMPPEPKLTGKAFLQTLKATAVVSPEFNVVLKDSQSTTFN